MLRKESAESPTAEVAELSRSGAVTPSAAAKVSERAPAMGDWDHGPTDTVQLAFSPTLAQPIGQVLSGASARVTNHGVEVGHDRIASGCCRQLGYLVMVQWLISHPVPASCLRRPAPDRAPARFSPAPLEPVPSMVSKSDTTESHAARFQSAPCFVMKGSWEAMTHNQSRQAVETLSQVPQGLPRRGEPRGRWCVG